MGNYILFIRPCDSIPITVPIPVPIKIEYKTSEVS